MNNASSVHWVKGGVGVELEDISSRMPGRRGLLMTGGYESKPDKKFAAYLRYAGSRSSIFNDCQLCIY